MGEIAQFIVLKDIVRDLNNKCFPETNSNDGSIAKDLNLIYLTSKVRIFEVADLIRHPYCQTGNLLHELKQVRIPVQVKWNFRLGNRVKIKYPFEEFKYIQRETIGWNSKLKGVVELSGFVCNMYSKYDNTVKVYFPDHGCSVSLYAGVLENIPKAFKDEGVASRWKVGDHVKTRMDPHIVKLLQTGFGSIPNQFIGQRARVIAVTKAGVFVTFNERTSYVINSALLLPSDEGFVIKLDFPRNLHGYLVGDKVNVIPYMEKVIENQKGKGILGLGIHWHPLMSKLCGKQLVVTDINGDGTVDAKLGSGRSWPLSSKSFSGFIYIAQNNTGDTKFKPNDLIQINIPDNSGNVLARLGIPTSFLEYVKWTAVVFGMDEHFSLVIKFSCTQTVIVNQSSVAKPDEAAVQKHKTIVEKVNNFKCGDRVFLDVGPPKFVTDILKEDVSEEFVIEALTKPSTLLGFTDMDHAVIQYDNDRKFRIDKKYLTVPEKFDVEDVELHVQDRDVSEIQ